jgi:hypothetical protein
MTAAPGGSPIIAAASISFSRGGDGVFKRGHGNKISAAKTRMDTREDMIRNHPQLCGNTGEIIQEVERNHKPLNRSSNSFYAIGTP